MVEYLFPHFLSDPKEYGQAEAIWRDRWEELLRRAGQERLWELSWLHTALINGSPVRDGNPIFSAISPTRKLAIRVIQLEPSDNPREFYVWTDVFAEGNADSVRELVITCVLTLETLSAAEKWIHQWITEEKIEQDTESNDDTIFPKVSDALPTTTFSDSPPASST